MRDRARWHALGHTGGMITPLDLALAQAYADEVHRQRLTAVEMQERTGIPGRTYRNYLGTRGNPPRNAMTTTVQWQLAQALGMSASEIMARAEQAVAAALGGDGPEAHLKMIGDPEVRAAIEAADAQEVAKRRRNGQPFG